MTRPIAVLDSTLRDGAQGEGISFSVGDKLRIVEILDDLGVRYIEAGNPGSNPKDLEFFGRAAGLKLKTAALAAFGSTRRKGKAAADDDNVRSLLRAETPVVVIFGKSWDFHVTRVLGATLEENLDMIRDTVAFFKREGREVVFDAEHFFDGARANESYAFRALQAGAEGGADCLVLCDTNGGSFPSEVGEWTAKAVRAFTLPIGVHCHNDDGMAVANSVMAVEAGASHVQGTLIGIGERCGNANLSAVIPTLQLKRGYACLPDDRLRELVPASRLVAELSNMPLFAFLPYVGKSAFAHKGGMHIDAVLKDPRTFEHVPPEAVGNERRVLMSEVSGRSTVLTKVRGICPEIDKESPEAGEIIDLLKDMEHKGYQYEGAEASFELLVRRHLGKYKPFFELERSTILEHQATASAGPNSSAMVVVNVDGERRISAAEGDGPVNALDQALRRALEAFYPELARVRLSDYKVRVLDPEKATAARVRVWIESTDGTESWTTVGVSTDILEASGRALVDAIEHKLLKTIERKFRPFL